MGRIMAVACMAMLATVSPVMAGGGDDPALIAAGHALAAENCAPCHAIKGPGPGPVADAPLFSRFARDWPIAQMAEALAEGIVAGHGPVRMPEFTLTPEQIDELLAYLVSVQE